MSLLGDSAVAALFDDRPLADEAWGLLGAEGIPATVLTQPEMLGAYQVSVVVAREDLARAQEILAPLINRQA